MGDNMIVKSMNEMNMNNRSRGTYAGTYKHNALKGRWMYPPSLLHNKNEHGSGKYAVCVIEQGSVISFEGGSEWFLVCTVFRTISTTVSAAKGYT